MSPAEVLMALKVFVSNKMCCAIHDVTLLFMSKENGRFKPDQREFNAMLRWQIEHFKLCQCILNVHFMCNKFDDWIHYDWVVCLFSLFQAKPRMPQMWESDVDDATPESTHQILQR